MKITKYRARFDLGTNEVVLDGLEMEDVQDGQLRLSKNFLYTLLDVIPPMKTAQKPRETPPCGGHSLALSEEDDDSYDPMG